MQPPGPSSLSPTSSAPRDFAGNQLFVEGVTRARDALAASAAAQRHADPLHAGRPDYLAGALAGGREYVRMHPLASAAFGLMVVYVVNRILRAR